MTFVFFYKPRQIQSAGEHNYRLVKDDVSFLNTSGEFIKRSPKYYKSLYKKKIEEVDDITKSYGSVRGESHISQHIGTGQSKN